MDWLTPELVSIVMGFVVMYVTSYLKNCDWAIQNKTLLAGAVSVVGAAAALFATGDVTWAEFGTSLPIVFASATAFYNLHFKDTKLVRELNAKKVL